jgi:hypothetical protein
MEFFDTVVWWMDTNLLEEFAAPFLGDIDRNPASSQIMKLVKGLMLKYLPKTGLFTPCNDVM